MANVAENVRFVTYDEYLNKLGFHRPVKNPKTLFAIVAKYHFGRSKQHFEVRTACVTYMRMHADIYAQHVPTNFTTYLEQMANPRTPGTLLELRVLARMYKFNVHLFQPLMASQWLVYNQHVETLFIFYDPTVQRFDPVARRMVSQHQMEPAVQREAEPNPEAVVPQLSVVPMSELGESTAN